MPLDVLMIGHGAIARYVAAAFAEDAAVRFRWVLCRPGREDAARAAIGKDVTAISAVGDIVGKPEFAVECAGHQAVRAHGAALLERGIDLGIVSIGALAEPGLLEGLEQAARSGGAQLELFAGAVGGIDALTAAKAGHLDRVVYAGRKPPAGWVGSPAESVVDLSSLSEPATFFEGTAREAARQYPKNANVAATVALAGLGLDGTVVTLIADPNIDRNIHEVVAEGTFGRFRIEIAGATLPDNPRSSALAAMSAVRAIRNRSGPVRL